MAYPPPAAECGRGWIFDGEKSMIPIQPTRFLQPNQAQQRPPTPFEDLLGDALERAFSSGITELAPLVAYLNQSGPLGPTGQPWTEQTFEVEIHKLGV